MTHGWQATRNAARSWEIERRKVPVVNTWESLIVNGLIQVEEDCGAINVVVDVACAGKVRQIIATSCVPDSWESEHEVYEQLGTSRDPGESKPAQDRIRVRGRSLSEIVKALVEGLMAEYGVEQRTVCQGKIEIQLYHRE